MDAVGVARNVTIKTRGRPGNVAQPRRSRRAGLLHQFGILRMLKCPLAFAVVIETEFVHRAASECPCVGNVPLLEALRQNAPEAGDIGARKLEVGERLQRTIIIKIVIDAQVLLVVDPVVDFHCELVAADGLGGDRADQITVAGRAGNKLQQINRRGVHASEGNQAGREHTRVCVAIRYRSAANRSVGRLAPRTVCQNRGVGNRPKKWPRGGSRVHIGEVGDNLPVHDVGGRRRFLGRRHSDRRRRDALADTAPFVRSKEEGSIFLDRSAESAAKLVLVELRLVARQTFRSRKAVFVGVEHFVAEELVQIPVPVVGPDLVTTLTTDPELRPYSASKVFVITRNSSMLSGEGWTVGRLANRSLASPPFTLKLLERPRPPFTETAPASSLP